LINRGGEKIAPLEVDQALLSHPEVAQAAAYALPHPRLGEDVAAAVILRPGAGVTPEALREFLSDKLAPFKIPRRIVVVDQLPKGISGKVQRKRLSEMMNGSVEGLAPVESRLHSDLMQIWKKVLKTDAISVDDNFFEKGGDSLLAMDVSVELERLTGRAQPEAILFEAPTIRELVKRTGRRNGRTCLNLLRPDAAEIAKVKEGILLTGATGALGSMLLQRLCREGYDVICLVRAGDNDAARARIEAIVGKKDNVTVLRGDVTEPRCGLTDADCKMLVGRFDRVLNCAGCISFYDQNATYLTNVAGMRHVLQMMDMVGVTQILHVSTAYVVGDGDYLSEEKFSKRPILAESLRAVEVSGRNAAALMGERR
jgi:acyl carrier protein